MSAVIWTDIIQAFIMLCGIVAIVIRGGIAVGGIEEIWKLNQQGARLNFYELVSNLS